MSLSALIALCLVITVALPGFAFYVTRRSTKANVISERIRIFQNQWRSPILNEDAVAQRLMNVILAPAVKRNLRLEITIELDFGRRALEETSIVVTVEAEPATALALGADDYLTKPIDRVRLESWLRRVAQRRGDGPRPPMSRRELAHSPR